MVTYKTVPSTKIFCLVRKETTYTYDREDDNNNDLLRPSKLILKIIEARNLSFLVLFKGRN
jgi:hypothetical protein